MPGAEWNLTLLIAFPLWIILNLWLQRRPRLIACVSQPASFPGGEPGGRVLTHSLILANAGRGDAFQVRIGHQTLPQFAFLYPKKFTVSPDFQYEVQAAAAGGADIVLPELMSSQQITITYFYEPPLNPERIHGEIRSRAGAARLVEVLPVAEYPWWLTLLGLQLLELVVIVAAVHYLMAAARAVLA